MEMIPAYLMIIASLISGYVFSYLEWRKRNK
jgi:hypothetical protein